MTVIFYIITVFTKKDSLKIFMFLQISTDCHRGRLQINLWSMKAFMFIIAFGSGNELDAEAVYKSFLAFVVIWSGDMVYVWSDRLSRIGSPDKNGRFCFDNYSFQRYCCQSIKLTLSWWRMMGDLSMCWKPRIATA